MTVSHCWIPSVISGAALCSVPFDLLILDSFALRDALQSHTSHAFQREGLPAAAIPVLVAPAPVGDVDPGATPDRVSPHGKSGRANSWLEGSQRSRTVSSASDDYARSKEERPGVGSLQGKSLDGGRKDGAKTSALRVLATSAAGLCGLPDGLLHALVTVESRWNPDARGAHGEVGLGQLSEAAARFMGVKDRRDPWANLLGTACFLSWHYGRTGDWTRALERFNGRGPAARIYAQKVLREWESRAVAARDSAIAKAEGRE